jgi:hypothetical protein
MHCDVKIDKFNYVIEQICDNSKNSNVVLACACVQYVRRICLSENHVHTKTRISSKSEEIGLAGVLVQKTTCVVRRSVMPYQLKHFLLVMSIESCAVTSCHNAHNQTTMNRYFTGMDIVACLPRHHTAVIHSIL